MTEPVTFALAGIALYGADLSTYNAWQQRQGRKPSIVWSTTRSLVRTSGRLSRESGSCRPSNRPTKVLEIGWPGQGYLSSIERARSDFGQAIPVGSRLG